MRSARLFYFTVLLISTLFFAFVQGSHASSFEWENDEFPEERIYGPSDQLHEIHGVSQIYKTRSLVGMNKLALTFDDGPSLVTTPQILDTLKKYGVHATFFLVTSRMTAATRPIVERMLREGHKIGNHSWDHEDSRLESEELFRQQLEKSELIVDRIKATVFPKQTEVFFRFPFAAYGYQKGYQHMNVIKEVSEKLYGANCINMVFWNMDSADYVPGMTKLDVFNNVKAQFLGGAAITYSVNQRHQILKKPYVIDNPPKGGVILMHDIHQHTADALPLILDWASKAGVEIVPLTAAKEYSFEGKECVLRPEYRE